MRFRPRPNPVVAPRALAAALAAAALAACTSGSGPLVDDRIDYRNTTIKSRPLEVPPDLTQLARESRYQTSPTGAVSAAAAASAPSTVPTATVQGAPAQVALASVGAIRVERDGQQRWLVTPQTPEQLWPQLRSFWEKSGFRLAVDDPKIGLLETEWSMNRAKLPRDVVRNTIGSILGNLYDTGERDMFRTRVERTAAGTEVSISHRGVSEVYIDRTGAQTTWTSRPSDPGLEAEMLARLMVALGGGAADTQQAQAAIDTQRPLPPTAAASAAVAAAPEAPPRARIVETPGGAALEVDEAFDRAWRRVGLALDRGGFTVEDRDRAQGLYYVRWVDPRVAGQEEPSFFARVFTGATDPQKPVRYRIALKGQASKTVVSVLTSAGAPEPGENGKRIVAQLVGELK